MIACGSAGVSREAGLCNMGGSTAVVLQDSNFASLNKKWDLVAVAETGRDVPVLN